MKLHSGVLDALDLGAALSQLESQRGDFLPSSLAARAANRASADFLPRLEARLRTGIDLRPTDVVFAHRYGTGTRPIPDLSIEARIVLEGLARLVADRLEADSGLLALEAHLNPSEGQKLDFESRPLKAPKAEYVAVADVASFYEYVDHDLLANELVELTGDPALAEAVKEILSELLGRGFGLPQGPKGSDVFASIYLSRVDRVLIRAGVTIDRFNDDYLFKAHSVARARRDVAALERSLRDLGLILNHAKTQILPAEAYEQGLKAFKDLLAAAAIDTIELPPGYTFDPDEFENILLESANETIIEAAFARALDDDDHPFTARQKMIDTALPYLAKFKNLTPLERLDELVEVWPAHIRNVNLYLRGLIGTEHEPAVVEATATALRNQPLALPWVQGWLIDVLARSSEAAPAIEDWLQELVASSSVPWFVRGRAMLALAHTDAFPRQEQVGEMFDTAPTAARPDIVGAVRIAEPDWSTEFFSTLTSGDVLLKQAADTVATGPLRSVL